MDEYRIREVGKNKYIIEKVGPGCGGAILVGIILCVLSFALDEGDALYYLIRAILVFLWELIKWPLLVLGCILALVLVCILIKKSVKKSKEIASNNKKNYSAVIGKYFYFDNPGIELIFFKDNTVGIRKSYVDEYKFYGCSINGNIITIKSDNGKLFQCTYVLSNDILYFHTNDKVHKLILCGEAEKKELIKEEVIIQEKDIVDLKEEFLGDVNEQEKNITPIKVKAKIIKRK